MVEKYYQVYSEGELVYDNLSSLSEAKIRLKELKEFDIIHHISGLHYSIEQVLEDEDSISSNVVLRDSIRVVKYKLTAKDSLSLKKLIKDDDFDNDSEDIEDTENSESSPNDTDFEEDSEEVSEDSTIANKTYEEYLKDSLDKLEKTDFRYYLIKILLQDSEAKSWGYLRDIDDLEGDEYDVVSPKNAKKIYKNISK